MPDLTEPASTGSGAYTFSLRWGRVAEALGGTVPRIENVVFGNHIKGQGFSYLETFTPLITRPQTFQALLSQGSWKL